MSFTEQLENAEKGTAFFIETGIWYFIIATLQDYRIYTIHDNHSYTFERAHDEEQLDELIRYRGLENVDWTFV